MARMHDFNFPSDETYKVMLKSLKLSKFESDPDIPSYVKARVHKKCKLGLRNGHKVVLDRATMKPIFKQSEMPDILKRFHDDMNHPGRDTTRNKIKQEYAFCNSAAVSNYVVNCKVCLKMKQRSKNLSRPLVVPIPKKHSDRSVLHQVDVDIIDMSSIQDPCGQKNRWLIQMVDHSSQFVWARALADKRSKCVATFIQSVFLQFGEPRVLHTENGAEFREEPFKEMLRRFPNVEHVSSHPRTTRTEPLLRKKIREWIKGRTGRRTWETELPFIVSNFNNSAKKSTTVPFEEMFLRPFVTRVATNDESDEEEDGSKGDDEEAGREEKGTEEDEDDDEEEGGDDSEEEEEEKDDESDGEEEQKDDERNDEDEGTEEKNSELPTILSQFLEEQEKQEEVNDLPIPSNRPPVLLLLQNPLKAVAIGYRCSEINEVRGNRATKQFQFYKLVKVIEKVFNPNDLCREELLIGCFVLWDNSNVLEDVGTTVREIEAKISELVSSLTDVREKEETEKRESQKRESKSIEFDILSKKAKVNQLKGRLKLK